MPDGDMRRPPLLWEQRLARRVTALGPGVSSSAATNVVDDFATSTGYDEPDDTITTLGTPSTPTVTGSLRMVVVAWDGLDTDGDAYNGENQWVDVHLGGSATFTPGTATVRGQLYEAGRLTIGDLDADTTYWAKFVGKDSEGNTSTASTAGSATTGLIVTSDIGTGQITAGLVSFNATAIGGIEQFVGTATPSTSGAEGSTWINTSNGAYYTLTGGSWVKREWDTDAIAVGAISTLQIATGAITAESGIIANAAIGSAQLGTAIITDANIASLSADKITAGSLSGDRISGGTISGSTFVTRGSGYRARLKDGGATGVDHLEFLNGNTVLAKLGATPTNFQVSVPTDFIIYNNSGGFGDLSVRDIGCNDIEAASSKGGSLTVGTATEYGFRVASDGDVFSYGVDQNTTANAANVRVGASAQLLKSTSTVRVKDDLQPLYGDLTDVPAEKISAETASVNWHDVLDICPTEFRSLSEVDNDERLLGFIAEDVAAKFPWAAEWDADGIPATVNDRPILAALLAVVKDQADTIADLTARIEALEG